jgi:hypothetical protein
MTGFKLLPNWGSFKYLKPPPVPLIDDAVPKKGDVRVVYGTLQFKEQEMAAKEDLEAMEEMTTVDQQPHNNYR